MRVAVKHGEIPRADKRHIFVRKLFRAGECSGIDGSLHSGTLALNKADVDNQACHPYGHSGKNYYPREHTPALVAYQTLIYSIFIRIFQHNASP
jgi:hypothetical protein